MMQQRAQLDSFNLVQRREAGASNKTGLPDHLKSGVEHLSGMSMDDVRVHYDSARPAQLDAHAYAQGSAIHLAPGQERQLPHEAWHVVQQKQGRVAPTMQMKGGVAVNDNRALESEADRMGELANAHVAGEANAVQLRAVTPLKQVTVAATVLQPQWAHVSDTGEHLNLIKTEDPEVFFYKKTGIKYKATGKVAADGHIIVQELSGEHTEYRHDQFATYKNWTASSTGVHIPTEFGPTGAYHNRGAPKITSKQTNYGNAKLGDAYTDYIDALKSRGESDKNIAGALLDLDDSALTSNMEKRGAAMLHTTVYLAEEWRKQGAAKIYRAILRAIVAGETDFDHFIEHFEFVGSADRGRMQVGRFKDVHEGDEDESNLNANERRIYGNMSPYHPGDYDTDDEMADEKKLSKGRDYSQSTGVGTAWKGYS
jgi:Domain of unknown function (DUF4157)